MGPGWVTHLSSMATAAVMRSRSLALLSVMMPYRVSRAVCASCLRRFFAESLASVNSRLMLAWKSASCLQRLMVHSFTPSASDTARSVAPSAIRTTARRLASDNGESGGIRTGSESLVWGLKSRFFPKTGLDVNKCQYPAPFLFAMQNDKYRGWML